MAEKLYANAMNYRCNDCGKLIQNILDKNSQPVKTADELLNVGKEYKSVDALNLAASYYSKANRFVNAMQCTQVALGIDSRNKSALSSAITLAFKLVESEGKREYSAIGVERIKKYISLWPNEAVKYFDLANIYNVFIKNNFDSVKDNDEAVKCYKKYLMIDANGKYAAKAFTNLAVIYGDYYKDYERAAAYAECAVALDHNSPAIMKNAEVYSSIFWNRNKYDSVLAGELANIRTLEQVEKFAAKAQERLKISVLKVNRLFIIYTSVTAACIIATIVLHSYWGAIFAIAAMITGYKAIDCGLESYLGTNGANLISKLPRVGILGGLLAFMMGFVFWNKDEILFFIIFALLTIINSIAVLYWEINEKATNISTKSKTDRRITIGWIVGSIVVAAFGFIIISSVNGDNKSNNSYNYRNYSSGTYSSSSNKKSSNNSSSSKNKSGSSSSNSSYYHNSYNYNADPLDYDSPDDYADDAFDDFGDWDEAYEYWEDY